MDRKRRIEMLLRVLLCPFLELPAQREDLLCAKAKAYQRMVAGEGDLASNRRAYERACERMEQWLEGWVRPDRLSEMGQLLEMYYPEEELRTHLSGWGREDLDGYYVGVLLQLAVEFITLRDGQISIRMWDEAGKDRYFQGSSKLYKVELWSVLSRIMTPDVLIAAYFASNGIDDVRQLAGVPDNLSLSDNLLAGVARRGIAETHMHLAAGMSYLTVWQVVTDPAAQRIFPWRREPVLQPIQREEQGSYSGLLVAGWLRLLMARYLEDEASAREDLRYYVSARREENPLEEHILRHLFDGPFGPQRMEHLREVILRNGQTYMAHLGRLCPPERGEELDVLQRGPYWRYRRLHTGPELLLLYFALRHIQAHPEHHQFARVFLDYVRMKNSYFRDKFQTFGGSGLAFFHRYFEAAASAIWRSDYEDRRKEQLVYQAAFRNQLHCLNLRKLEVKISPRLPGGEVGGSGYGAGSLEADKRAIARQLSQVFTAYLQVCEEQPRTNPIPCLGIVYHFSKKDVHHPVDNGCWAALRGERPTDEVSLVRAQCIRFLKALRELIEEVPMLNEYVVALDAASQELRAEPWVYAPVYRYARSRENTLPLHPKTGLQMQSIGLTYHVGEDYHHVLTGLRHIDEVVTHFGYKAGDRLGHGMVLQVELGAWIHDHETVPVPCLDRLEDLIWVWSLCEECPEELGKYRSELEGKLMKLATQILKNTTGLSPYVLWSAYSQKFTALESIFCRQIRTCAFTSTEEITPLQPVFRMEGQRPFCALTREKTPIWDPEKLRLTNHCPIYTRHYKKPMLVSTLPEDLPMLQAVQRHMRQKIQNLGIYVETNPTSNVSIGDISSLRDYPITRLNAPPLPEPDPMTILLSINSDDPLVFNTNVENELALVYHMLTHRGYGREEILNWINKVRQYGMDSSFIRGEKERACILEELREIVGNLTRVMGWYRGG